MIVAKEVLRSSALCVLPINQPMNNMEACGEMRRDGPSPSRVKIWLPQDYLLRVKDGDIATAGAAAFTKVFRTAFDQPGFVILVLDSAVGSQSLRRKMVRLKEEFSRLHQQQWQEGLSYLSLGRFDQQTTTKLHLDGAPPVSFLMLGYEATQVPSEFAIADYSRCAWDLGMTPAEFLQQHNPMFGAQPKLLGDYTTTISQWQEERPRIVVINNGSTAPESGLPGLGVLHGATIKTPQAHLRRVINSTMVAPARYAPHDVSKWESEFATTDAISGPILAT